jgi:hypothetical protein
MIATFFLAGSLLCDALPSHHVDAVPGDVRVI